MFWYTVKSYKNITSASLDLQDNEPENLETLKNLAVILFENRNLVVTEIWVLLLCLYSLVSILKHLKHARSDLFIFLWKTSAWKFNDILCQCYMTYICITLKSWKNSLRIQVWRKFWSICSLDIWFSQMWMCALVPGLFSQMFPCFLLKNSNSSP